MSRLLPLLVTALACGRTQTAPVTDSARGRLPNEPHLELRWHQLPSDAPPHAVELRAPDQARTGTVEVAGSLGAGYSCFHLLGGVDVRNPGGAVLEVVLAGPRDADVGCAAAIGRFGYRAVLHELPTGALRLQVRHRVEGWGAGTKARDTTVLDTTVQVR